MKLIFWLKSKRKAILWFFISGIFWVYFERIWTWIVNAIVSFALVVSDKFSESYYGRLAENATSEGVPISLIAILAVTTLGYIAIVDNRNTMEREIVIARKKEIVEIKKALETLPALTKEDQEAKLKRLEHSIGELTERKRLNFKFLLPVAYSASILMVIQTISDGVTSIAKKQNDVFRNDLIKIDPYVAEIEIKKLRSEWASMKRKSDFDRIHDKVNTFKKKFNID